MAVHGRPGFGCETPEPFGVSEGLGRRHQTV